MPDKNTDSLFMRARDMRQDILKCMDSNLMCEAFSEAPEETHRRIKEARDVGDWVEMGKILDNQLVSYAQQIVEHKLNGWVEWYDEDGRDYEAEAIADHRSQLQNDQIEG